MPRLKGITLLCLLAMLCLFSPADAGPAAERKSPEDARIARLVGLGRVWGTIKLFHPYLAYRVIDWDRALVDTIPKVDAAASPQDYTAAINSMLSRLKDSNTYAETGAGTGA